MMERAKVLRHKCGEGRGLKIPEGWRLGKVEVQKYKLARELFCGFAMWQVCKSLNESYFAKKYV